MDTIKIGSFIAERRKAQKLTQAKLGEILGVSDRAVSKWECGKSMPDVSLMADLCEVLKITLNDLFNGEVVEMKDYNEKSEKLILDLAKEKELADKQLLSMEIVIGVLSVAIMLGGSMVAAHFQMADWMRILIIVLSFIICLVGCFFAIKIEQTAGYYQCKNCGHRYVPTFKSVLFSAHMGRTRKMRCPECHEKTWQKKVISKK